MSELQKLAVLRVFNACEGFSYAYKQYQLHPGNPMTRARALAALSTLEATVDDHVTEETERVKEIVDGAQPLEPPF